MKKPLPRRFLAVVRPWALSRCGAKDVWTVTGVHMQLVVGGLVTQVLLLLLTLTQFTVHPTPRRVGRGGDVVDMIGRYMRAGDLGSLGVGVRGDTVVV